MATQTALSISQLAIEQLNGSRRFVLGLIETLTDEQLIVRAAGSTGNHALWVMGHLALGEDRFVSSFHGVDEVLPQEHRDLFDVGTTPKANADDYPSRGELLRRLDTMRARTIDWVAAMNSDSLWQPSPESLAHVAPNAISAAYTLANHDFLHAGQLATIRASLGMKPLMM